jgi:hypothetical protein
MKPKITKEQLENLINDVFKSYDERNKPSDQFFKFYSPRGSEEFNKALKEEYKKQLQQNKYIIGIDPYETEDNT